MFSVFRNYLNYPAWRTRPLGRSSPLSPIVGLLVVVLLLTAPASVRASFHGPIGIGILGIAIFSLCWSLYRTARGVFASLLWVAVTFFMAREIYFRPAPPQLKPRVRSRVEQTKIPAPQAAMPTELRRDRVDIFAATDLEAERMRGEFGPSLLERIAAFFSWENLNPWPPVQDGLKDLEASVNSGVNTVTSNVRDIGQQGLATVNSATDSIKNTASGAMRDTQRFIEGDSGARSPDIKGDPDLSDDAYFPSQRGSGGTLDNVEKSVREMVE